MPTKKFTVIDFVPLARRTYKEMSVVEIEVKKLLTTSRMSNYQIWRYLNYDRQGAKIVVSQRTIDTMCRRFKNIRVDKPVFTKQRLGGGHADPNVLEERDRTDNAYNEKTDSEGNDTAIISYTTTGSYYEGEGQSQSVTTASEHVFLREIPINCSGWGIGEGKTLKKKYVWSKTNKRPLTKEEIYLIWELRKRRNQKKIDEKENEKNV